MQISVVIPLYNEEESLPELLSWIQRVMQEHRYTYEVLFIDDGSRDSSWEIIEEMAAKYPEVRGIKFRRNYGKSAALNVGFEAVQGDVVITMDADLQDSPEEIPDLYRMITQEKYDLVSGWKKKRYDPLMKTIPSKFFNKVTSIVSGISLHDFNCGLKAYRNTVVKSVEVYGEMHRYIPVMAKWAGFDRIGEKVVAHQERKYGVTKFGLERFINGFLDLLSITFVARFGKRPMHLFGTLGTLNFVVGFFIAVYLVYHKLQKLEEVGVARDVTDQPLFYFALVMVILGVMLFSTGFLAELVSRSSADRNKYNVEARAGVVGSKSDQTTSKPVKI